jgi:hypothetical protein
MPRNPSHTAAYKNREGLTYHPNSVFTHSSLTSLLSQGQHSLTPKAPSLHSPTHHTPTTPSFMRNSVPASHSTDPHSMMSDTNTTKTPPWYATVNNVALYPYHLKPHTTHSPNVRATPRHGHDSADNSAQRSLTYNNKPSTNHTYTTSPNTPTYFYTTSSPPHHAYSHSSRLPNAVASYAPLVHFLSLFIVFVQSDWQTI